MFPLPFDGCNAIIAALEFWFRPVKSRTMTVVAASRLRLRAGREYGGDRWQVVSMANCFINGIGEQPAPKSSIATRRYQLG
jgi:hypothetical protein